VFFWPTRQRCEQLLGARAYRGQSHTVIEVDTTRLLEQCGRAVTLSRINAGSVLYNPPRRGSLTFAPLAEVRFDEWRHPRGRAEAIADIAVDYAVPDMAAVTSAVFRADSGDWTRIWGT
jgi:hypothetical protein